MMSAVGRLQSPSVAKTEIALSGDSPKPAATFAYWDHVLGPKTEEQLLSDGEIIPHKAYSEWGNTTNSKSGAIDIKFFVAAEKGCFSCFSMSFTFDGNWNVDRSTYGLSYTATNPVKNTTMNTASNRWTTSRS